jgi:DNA excision repair protein ERCC-4
MNNLEPDPTKAVTIGAEEDPEVGAGANAAAEEVLRCLPGITAKNVKYVMSKVHSVRHLCEMEISQVQEILGVEPGKACWEFMHQGERIRWAFFLHQMACEFAFLPSLFLQDLTHSA